MNLYAYVGNDPFNRMDPSGEDACAGLDNCIQATNFKAAKSDGKTVTQSGAIDAAAVSELPKNESSGDHENAVRFDENGTNVATTTQVPSTTEVKGNVFESTVTGLKGAEAMGHSHPNDKSDPAPGPKDDRAVNGGLPNNIAHRNNVIVVEKVAGQFRIRILNDASLTKHDLKNMGSRLKQFQRRIQ
jgi:hypothetical protein